MAGMLRVVFCVNQFFGGLGGEEKASMPPILVQAAKGPAALFQKLFPDLQVTETLVVGDNYVAENTTTATREILSLLEAAFNSPQSVRPCLVVAGPAFSAGRYGLACGAICKAVQEHFGIPAVTAMFPDNPAVNEYRRYVVIARAGENVLTLEEDLNRMGRLGRKLIDGDEILPQQDEYLPHGSRKNYFAERTGAERAVDMLLQKINGEPFTTEYPMPTFDRVEPAPAIADMSRTKLALVTSGGIVPRGNPDRIAAANAQCFGIYSLAGLTTLTPKTHQTAHGGYDPTYANADPNRVLPLDAVRELETEGAIGTLYEYYFATVGNATSVENAGRFGREIALQLLKDGVQAVILTST